MSKVTRSLIAIEPAAIDDSRDYSAVGNAVLSAIARLASTDGAVLTHITVLCDPDKGIDIRFHKGETLAYSTLMQPTDRDVYNNVIGSLDNRLDALRQDAASVTPEHGTMARAERLAETASFRDHVIDLFGEHFAKN